MDGKFYWTVEKGVAILLCNGVPVAQVHASGKKWRIAYLGDTSGEHPTMYAGMVACERKFHIASEIAR